MKQKLLILWSALWYRFAYLGKGYADAVPVLLPKEERTKILDYNKWQPIDITPVRSADVEIPKNFGQEFWSFGELMDEKISIGG